jgi:predicted nucleic acid-binding protein
MKFNSSHVVVDADVARSAGLSEHPVSKSSRNVLRGISDSGLHVAFCPILLSEWRKHRSLLSAHWLASMIARKKFHCDTPITQTQSEIESATLSESDQAIAEKDAHVIDIAIANGNFIASNDKIARGVFSVVANSTKLLDRLVWAVPTDSSDALVDIFTNGGLVPDAWRVRVT